VPQQPVLILTGPPGAGKTSVARLVADRFERAACVEADWFWTTIVKGFVPPWELEADAQNRTVLRSCAAAAATLADGGFPVVLEGIIGPWMLPIATGELQRLAIEGHHVVLRPRLDVALRRATARVGEERVPGHSALTDEEPIRQMWHAFSDLGMYEVNVLDNSDLGAVQVADLIWARLQAGDLRL
jgi:hypothetical protein